MGTQVDNQHLNQVRDPATNRQVAHQINLQVSLLPLLQVNHLLFRAVIPLVNRPVSLQGNQRHNQLVHQQTNPQPSQLVSHHADQAASQQISLLDSHQAGQLGHPLASHQVSQLDYHHHSHLASRPQVQQVNLQDFLVVNRHRSHLASRPANQAVSQLAIHRVDLLDGPLNSHLRNHPVHLARSRQAHLVFSLPQDLHHSQQAINQAVNQLLDRCLEHRILVISRLQVLPESSLFSA